MEHETLDLTPTGAEAVEWHWLRPHHERDALWVVSPALDLAAVAAALAHDDAPLVRQWLAAGQLAKPSAAQLTTWNAAPLTMLTMMIVQPFVLVQERPSSH